MSSWRSGGYRGRSVVSGRTLLFLTLLTYAAAADFRQLVYLSGEAVMLNVNASEVYDSRWNNGTHPLARNKQLVGPSGRFQLFPNGSLVLLSGKYTDSGNYSVEVYRDNGELALTITYGLLILDVPEVRAQCALDGSLKLTCSVRFKSKYPMMWVGTGAPANQSMTPVSELTLYLPRMKGNITCVVYSKPRQAHSLQALLDCRGRVPLVVVVVMFSLSVLTLGLLHLRTTCNRTPPTVQKDSLYEQMHGYRKPTKTSSFPSESSYVPMQSNLGVLPQGDAANTYVYEFCEPKPAPPGGSARTLRSSTGEDVQENIIYS